MDANTENTIDLNYLKLQHNRLKVGYIPDEEMSEDADRISQYNEFVTSKDKIIVGHAQRLVARLLGLAKSTKAKEEFEKMMRERLQNSVKVPFLHCFKGMTVPLNSSGTENWKPFSEKLPNSKLTNMVEVLEKGK